MNKAIIIGNVTKDLELKRTQSGQAVINFNVAVQRNFTNDKGEREADFISVVAWGKIAENASTYLGKGSKVAIEGRIQVRNYEDKDGKKVYIVEIVAEQVQFLDTKEPNKNTITATSNASINNARSVQKDSNNFFDSFKNKELDINADELPF